MKIKKLILIGSSTGGPGHIQKIIKSIQKDFDATILVAQHMQSSFLASFAKQLNNNSQIDVLLLKNNQLLRNRKVYILDENYEIMKDRQGIRAKKDDTTLSYTPNIDLLFNSLVKISTGIKILCIVLTGIGDDGAKGALNLAKSGATCIYESQESAIVYGMPKAAHELNPQAPQLNIFEICDEIRSF